jgi:predicted dehydrogenase
MAASESYSSSRTGRSDVAALRTGLIDLDTSHPDDFVPLIRELGHDVVAVLDGGTVHAGGYAASFARQHGIAEVVERASDIVDLCDAVFLLSVDWDRSMAVLEELVPSGTPVFLDKPLAGTPARLRRLTELAAAGYPLTGGSALRYVPEAQHWRERQRGKQPRMVVVGSWGHPFHYGVHAAALTQALLGPGLETASALASPNGIRGVLHHQEGADILVEVPGRAGGSGFFATVVTDADVTHISPSLEGVYRPVLARSLGYFAGDLPAPVGPDGLVEPELAILALAFSAHQDGRQVRLDAIPDDFAAWGGAEFTRLYRAERSRAQG